MMPKIVDLFSGCGGLTLGFEKAGFEVVAGIEMSKQAFRTISYNTAWRYGKNEVYLCADITKTNESIFDSIICKEECILIGGPPCQAYSRAGKGKLKSLGENRINIRDPRGYLYQDYLRFIRHLRPRVIVMENVPESVSFGDMNIPEIICKELEKVGYNVKWTILNSADYGVPQIRERIVLIGSLKKENASISFPKPTHKNLDRSLTFNQRRFHNFTTSPHFVLPIPNDEAEKTWVTVKEAFSDLPILFPYSSDKYKNISVTREMDYLSDAQNEFQYIMRNWYGEETEAVTANSFRKTQRDFPIFDRMKQGDNYTDALKIALDLFNKETKVYGYSFGSFEYESLKKKMVPSYNNKNFENKWKRLDSLRPSHTVVAHLSKDTYSHIHPWEPRGISIREAARLQSFPDDFFFNCSMGEAFKQIGNAVPPLLAYAIAKKIRDYFEEK